jgi:putative methyltransferase
MPAEAALPSFADLQRELSPISPRAWRFAALRAASRAGALLSDGLRIGYRHGFDSGPFMAHVYANRPSGRTALGRAIDRRLLRRRTCVAFREIRALAERAVFDALRAERGPAPVVADLAAGPAPYLLSALTRHTRARAILSDTDPDALAAARRDAEAFGVADRVQLVQADAFDRAALQALRPSPDVVVELGLYGIYHDDALVERHFHDLAGLVSPSQIVFNVQTRNPEIEHIARVWINHEGERCVWRLRPVEQLLGWARDAGYEPVAVEADRFDIYRVVRLVREDEAA